MEESISLLTHVGYYSRLVELWRQTGCRKSAWEQVEKELGETFGLRRFLDYQNMIKYLRKPPRKNEVRKICFVECQAVKTAKTSPNFKNMDNLL